jgi:hypothetical protein
MPQHDGSGKFLHSAGQAGAAWAQVSGFYSFFQGFATLKDFAWADEHNPAAAPNRKVVHHRASSTGGQAASPCCRVDAPHGFT